MYHEGSCSRDQQCCSLLALSSWPKGGQVAKRLSEHPALVDTSHGLRPFCSYGDNTTPVSTMLTENTTSGHRAGWRLGTVSWKGWEAVQDQHFSRMFYWSQAQWWERKEGQLSWPTSSSWGNGSSLLHSDDSAWKQPHKSHTELSERNLLTITPTSDRRSPPSCIPLWRNTEECLRHLMCVPKAKSTSNLFLADVCLTAFEKFLGQRYFTLLGEAMQGSWDFR